MGESHGYPKYAPYQVGSENYLGIYLHPKKVRYRSYKEDGNARQRIETHGSLEKFYFLAPEQLMDNITHEYQPLENLVSKAADMVGQAKSSANLGTAVHKVETPLVYSGSDRRKVEIMVNLGVYDDPYRDVVWPIEMLRKYSAPSFTGESVTESKIELPAIFKLSTTTGGGDIVPLINIKHAVLTAVQPTFYSPYIKGVKSDGLYPSRAEVTLSFQDMEPMTKDSFQKVTTKET